MTGLFCAFPANALNEQVRFFAAVAFGECHGGDADVIQAGCLAASFALEMNVVVLMMAVGAGFAAKGVFGAALIVEHLMKQPFVQKRAQCPVYRDAVVVITQTTLHIAVRQRMTSIQEQVEHLLPTRGVAEFKVFERLGRCGHPLACGDESLPFGRRRRVKLAFGRRRKMLRLYSIISNCSRTRLA